MALGDAHPLMARMGCVVEKHHHEVASAQHELGLKFAPLTVMADRMQIYKGTVSQQVANIYGKTATFMPKPIYGDNGSACTATSRSGRAASRCLRRQQVCRPLRNLPVLYRRHHQEQHLLNDQCLHQPDDQLDKRLVPGFEAPALLAYSAAQPLGVVPYSVHDQPEGQKRVEVRFPDPLANPYRPSP